MKLHRPIAPFITIVLIAMVGLVSSCSDKGTNPGGGNVPKELDSGDILNGAQYAHVFAGAGTYNYHCTIHGFSMSGQVIVVGGSPMTAAVTITNNTYTPSPATVAPGGTVTWTNNGSTHTVTSN